MEYRVLGPLEVVDDDGRALALGGEKQRALLALLLLHRNEVVAADHLVNELWGESPPPTAAKMVQVYVSRLRKELGRERLVTRAGGYTLHVGPEELDLDRFERLRVEGRRTLAAGDAERAADSLHRALKLWRGTPLSDLGDERFAELERARLGELRLAALEDRVDADLALRQDGDLVGELERLVAQEPLRERFRGQLMHALYRAGRQAEALQVYQDTRRMLLDELGLEPSQALRRLERAILQQDEGLDPPARAREPQAAEPLTIVDQRPRIAGSVAAGAIAALSILLLAAFAATRSRGGGIGEIDANAVGAIDPAANTVVDEVPVGADPIALAADSGSLWVANAVDRSISRIDLRRRRTTRTLAVGANPTSVATTAGAVWVIAGGQTKRLDPRFNSIVKTIRAGRVNTFARTQVSAARAGTNLWIADGYGVAQIDGRTNRIVRRVQTGDSPSGIAAYRNDVWVSDNVDNTVTRVEPTNATTTIPVARGPRGIAAGAGAVWVAATADNALVRIDPEQAAVVTTIPVGRQPTSVAFAAGSVWVANREDGTVSRVDPAHNRVVATVDVGGRPEGIAFADGLVWVANRGRATSGFAPPQGGTAQFASEVDIANFPEGLNALDPGISLNSHVWTMFYATCAKLLNYPDARAPAGSQLQPEVATAMPSLSHDRKTYTFTIRNGFRFSPPSREPVTARTFKYTIERTLNPKLRSPAAQLLGLDIVGQREYTAGRAKGLRGVVAKGNKLTIRMTRVDPAFPAKLATPFFCAVPADTPMEATGPDPIASAGPYYFSEHVPNQRIVLERNANYRGSRPRRLDRVVYTFGRSSSREIAAAIEAGRVDYALDGVPGSANAQLEAKYGADSPGDRPGRPQYFVNLTPGVRFLVLNPKRPLFAAARMRRAFNYAIDRTALAAQGNPAASDPALDRPGAPTDQYLAPSVPGFRDARIYPFRPDLAKARRLAGRRGATAMMYTCTDRVCAAIAEIVRRDLRRIGLDVRIQRFPLDAMFERENTPGEPFDIGLGGWVPVFLDPGDVLNPLFEDSPFFGRQYRARVRAASRLTGPARHRAYGDLDVALARDEAPFAAFAVLARGEFFSARVGCEILHPVYTIDIGALCLRR